MTPGFMDCHAAWRRAGFPGPGSGTGLKLTYADLADADEYVTTVIRFVERGVHRPAPVDVLGMLDELMDRIDRLAAESCAEDQEVAGAACVCGSDGPPLPAVPAGIPPSSEPANGGSRGMPAAPTADPAVPVTG